MAVRMTRAGVGLTVGIIVLALVVLGGLYLVKERGEQARREDAIEIAQGNLESESQNGSVEAPSIDGVGEGVTPESNDSENSGAAPNELPATGMSEIAPVLGIGLLAFSVASYLASRRALLN